MVILICICLNDNQKGWKNQDKSIKKGMKDETGINIESCLCWTSTPLFFFKNL